MKFIITEEQKKQIIKHHLSEQETSNGNSLGNVWSNIIKAAGDKLRNLGTSSSSSNSSSETGSNVSNVQGSGNLGNIKLVGSFDGEAKNNISLLIDAMKQKGITDPLAQIGILSVIKKESNFKPKGEVSYAGTDNSRIRGLFGSRVKNFTDEQLNKLKSNAKDFFNLVYANTVGNQGGDDGWNFRGRGFNQLTGRKNYRKYGEKIGANLEGNPELLNQNDVASKVAIEFLTKGKTDFPKFNTKEEAATYFADINAGGGAGSHRNKAVEASKSFDVA